MTALAAHRAFLSDTLARQAERRTVIDPTYTYTPQPEIRGHTPSARSSEAGPSKRNVPNYVEGEETVRNDLSERYIESGEFGSNYILGAADREICEEYPALRKLMDLKTEHVIQNAHPPLLLPLADTSANTLMSSISPSRFDVILLRPLETWEGTAELPIRNISADPSFVFLWVGKGDDEGLEKGRECFAKWGFRRAEDIVWVKTKKNGRGVDNAGGSDGKEQNARGTGGGGLFASSKEHCLMGIRGTVRRSTDTRFVHCNVDTDIMVWEQNDSKERYPPYLYTLIENFCLGTRRLELFNNNLNSARRGWVTATTHTLLSVNEDTPQQFDPATYPSLLPREEVRPILPFHPEIDQLRPKSPPRRGANRGGHLPVIPHQQGRPPRHHHNQNQMPHHPQMQMQAQAQAQMQMQMQMQAQMHHMQMMAAMNMNMGMPDPTMMQGMGMGHIQDPGHGQGGWGYGGPQSPSQGGYDQQAWQGGYQYDPQGGPGKWQGGQFPHQPGAGPGQGPGWGWQ